MRRKLILEITAPGLGDHLFFSPIPRLAKKYNVYDEIYISDFSNFSRNEGIYKKIIWEANPYIDGFLSDRGIIPPPIDYIKIKDFNIIDNYLNYFGIPAGKNNLPELYHQFNFIKKLEDKNIYDPNCISYWVADNLNKDIILNFFNKNNITIYAQFPIKYNGILLPDIPVIDYKNNFINWCDCVFSCKNFYCMFSGSSNLRAAMKKPANVLIKQPLIHDVSAFMLNINNYFHL